MVNDYTSLADLPFEQSCKVPFEQLKLDRENPRLLIDFQGNASRSDEAVIAQLYRREELSELLQSIAANGYLDIEPLIVLEQQGKLTVLEGNRRLAAVRLLLQPELADRIKDREDLSISVPDMSADRRATLEQVSVYRVAQRDHARSFIGFKHINGPARWDSYAKARFAADWYRSEEIALAEIAGKIGDSHNTIKRMVNAIYVLEQAEAADLFHLRDRMSARFNFSHLYTALSRKDYMEFLGLDAAWTSYDPEENPVPEDRKENLRKVLRWIYGSKPDGLDPVVRSQNPDIKRLGEVLAASGEGLNILLAEKPSLDEAHVSTQPIEEQFRQGLVRVRQLIRELVISLRGFDGQDTSLVDIAEEVSVSGGMILDQMRKKVSPSVAKDA